MPSVTPTAVRALKLWQPPSPSVAEAGRFRPDIEGLRGVAVLLVVLYHARFPGMTGGFVGVDVFFVLSGYLITRLLVSEIETTGTLSLPGFYARRARRLIPAAALMLFTTALVSLVVFTPLEQARFARSLLATTVYLSNLWFLLQAGDYFAADVQGNPFLHTWSLAVEEQFYLLWPLLVVAALRGASPRRRLVLWLGVLTVASFALSVHFTYAAQPVAFFGTPMRAWEFSLGALAGLCLTRAAPEGRRGQVVLGWAGLGAIAVAAVALSERTPFPGMAALLPALGTAAVLVACAGAPAAGVGRLLGTPALQWLGRRSYSWYLWHWPALVIAAALAPGLSLRARLLVAAGSLVVAAAAYALVEHPIRTRARTPRGSRPALAGALLLSLGGVGVATAWEAHARRAGNTPEQRAYVAAAGDTGPLREAGCFARATETGMAECHFGARGAEVTVVLFGDSHALQWFPAVQRLAEQRGWHLVTLLRGSCPAAAVTVRHLGRGPVYTECDAWRRAALARIAALGAELVVVGQAVYVPSTGHHGVSYARWEAGNRQTLAQLVRGGGRAILIHDSPRARFDVPTCLSRAAMAFRGRGATDGCAFPRSTGLDSQAREAERRAARGLDGVLALDLADQFCDARTCPAVRNGLVVYQDGSHLTATYAASLAETFAARTARFLDGIGPGKAPPS